MSGCVWIIHDEADIKKIEEKIKSVTGFGDREFSEVTCRVLYYGRDDEATGTEAEMDRFDVTYARTETFGEQSVKGIAFEDAESIREGISVQMASVVLSAFRKSGLVVTDSDLYVVNGRDFRSQIRSWESPEAKMFDTVRVRVLKGPYEKKKERRGKGLDAGKERGGY